MVDKISKDQRSSLMRAIRSKDTKPEILVRSFLHRAGYRFRLHEHNLPGRPDITLKKYRTAIQIRGCFWHNHSCPIGRIPESRVAYWLPKLTKTKTRDRRNDRKLRALGWSVIVIWECQLKPGKHLEQTIRRVKNFLDRKLTALKGDPKLTDR